MDEITFYDKSGCPVAYTEDGVNIFLFTGKPVAYFEGDSIFSFSGKHLGWFRNGWICDNSGLCVLFRTEATGGPIKPVKQVKPVKNVKNVKPVRSVKEVRPVRKNMSSSWSDTSGVTFFCQE